MDSVFTRVLKGVVEKDPMRAKDILNEAYCTGSGIYDYMTHSERDARLPLEQRQPMIADAMHPAENLRLVSPYTSLMRRFVEAKVRDYFGLDWLQFIEQTHEQIEDMFAVCFEQLKSDQDRHRGALDNLKKDLGK